MMNEFVMNKDKGKPADGFVPEITAEIGYGTQVATDPETGKLGLVPIPTTIMAGASGRERITDNPQCYAKALQFDNVEEWVYYVRMNTHGDLSDPWGLYTDAASNARAANHRGTHEWEFRRVNQDAFLTFLKYLATRNKALLRICERVIKDG